MSKLLLVSVFAGLALAALTITAEEKALPQASHEQSQDGVTVRLESLTLERVFNEPAFWEQRYGPDWKQKRSDRTNNAPTPKWIVSVFVSVVGSGNNSGPVTVEFAKYKTRVGYEAHFSPPLWQRRFRTLKVDPKARGHESWWFIRDGTGLDDLFPATVTVGTTNKSDKNLEFVFKDVKF